MSGKMQIDLRSPDGNAFALIGLARKMGKQLGYHKPRIDAIVGQMAESDYKHLLKVFEDNFGNFVELTGKDDGE